MGTPVRHRRYRYHTIPRGSAGESGGGFDYIDPHVNEIEEILRARNATVEENRRLELPAQDTIIEITQTFRLVGTNVDEDITVVTLDIVFTTDCYELRYVMEIK